MRTYSLDVWGFNELGNIILALNRGFYGTSEGFAGGMSATVTPTTEVVYAAIPVFNCVSVSVFNLLDLDEISRLTVPDIRNPPHAFHSIGGVLSVFEYETRASPAAISTYLSWDGVGVIFIRSGTKIIITFGAGAGYPWVFLANCSENYPEDTRVLY